MNDPIIVLVEICQRLATMGLGTSTSGNVSVRTPEGMVVTATGVSLGETNEGNVALVDATGTSRNNVKPSKEAGLHLIVYENSSEADIIIHVHPAHTIAVSCLIQGEQEAYLPAVTPTFVMRAGMVPITPYAHPGTELLAQYVGERTHGRAVVLRNHGLVVWENTARQALGVMEEIEENCRIWLMIRDGGKLLSTEEVNELLTRKM